MVNFKEVHDDILKEQLLDREEKISSLTCDEDKEHGFILMKLEILLDDNLMFLMIIFQIILALGMRSIIGISSLMVCR